MGNPNKQNQPVEKPSDNKKEANQKPELDTEVLGISRPDENAIDTIDALKEAYPELVEVIIAERTKQLDEFFGNRTPAQIKEHFPDLYARIVADATKCAVPDLKVPGFLLSLTDPFAAGTLRTFTSLSNRSGLQLPFVLPFKDKNSKVAIQGYIIRAEGGGDYERAKLAKEALKKCK